MRPRIPAALLLSILALSCSPLSGLAAEDSDASRKPIPGSSGETQKAPATPAQPPALSNLSPWGPGMHSVLPRLALGADLRVRHEYHYNAFTLNSDAPDREYDYQRYRMRVEAALLPVRSLELNARLTTERRWYIKPDSLDGSRPDEILFDAMNVAVRNPGGLPFTLRVGRQDIVFGNGWVVMDATPGDGSRTIFFDAARLTWDFRAARTTVNAIGIANASIPDTWLPIVRNLHKPVTEQQENGAILYVSNRAFSKTAIDGYFIYKHDRKVQANGSDADIKTLGSLVQREFSPRWRYRLEVALERGAKNGADLRSFGITHRLTYSFGDARRHRVHLGHEYLSGDDPATNGVDEGWDPLWGRWPQWSELLVSNLATETRSGNWTNLQRIDFGWACSPTEQLELSANYMPLFAPANSLTGRPGFSSDGGFRGHFGQAILRFRFSEHLSAHIWGEVFSPGSYYSAPKGDTACFVRAEAVVRW